MKGTKQTGRWKRSAVCPFLVLSIADLGGEPIQQTACSFLPMEELGICAESRSGCDDDFARVLFLWKIGQPLWKIEELVKSHRKRDAPEVLHSMLVDLKVHKMVLVRFGFSSIPPTLHLRSAESM